jgi:hypothetical protein
VFFDISGGVLGRTGALDGTARSSISGEWIFLSFKRRIKLQQICAPFGSKMYYQKLCKKQPPERYPRLIF